MELARAQKELGRRRLRAQPEALQGRHRLRRRARARPGPVPQRRGPGRRRRGPPEPARDQRWRTPPSAPRSTAWWPSARCPWASTSARTPGSSPWSPRIRCGWSSPCPRPRPPACRRARRWSSPSTADARHCAPHEGDVRGPGACASGTRDLVVEALVPNPSSRAASPASSSPRSWSWVSSRCPVVPRTAVRATAARRTSSSVKDGRLEERLVQLGEALGATAGSAVRRARRRAGGRRGQPGRCATAQAAVLGGRERRGFSHAVAREPLRPPPVFATVLILVICVVGIAGYIQLGVDRSPRSTSRSSSSSRACPAPRPRRSRPRSPTRSKRRSTPSAASTSCARSRPRACRRSSSPSCSRRTSTSPSQEVRDHVSHDPARSAARTSTRPSSASSIPTPRRSSIVALQAPDKPIREVTELADKQVRRQLENITGVGQVTLARRAQAPDQRLARPGEAARRRADRRRTCSARIAAQNLTMPGGSVETGRAA